MGYTNPAHFGIDRINQGTIQPIEMINDEITNKPRELITIALSSFTKPIDTPGLEAYR
jgi:hypothetical protein